MYLNQNCGLYISLEHIFQWHVVYIVVGSTVAGRGVTTGHTGGTGNTQINGNDDNSSSGGGAGASDIM